jgi:hypothetical protein
MNHPLRRLLTLALSLLLVISLTACDSSNPDAGTPEPLPFVTASDVPADPVTGVGPGGRPVGTGEYTFYSLRDSAIVGDSLSADWDIALQSTNILVNGGTSGPGQGAGYVAERSLEEIDAANPDAFVVDDADAGTFAVTPGSGNGWYSYNSNGQNYVRPIPGRTIVVRTADGEGVAKIRILSYYRGNPSIPIDNRDDHPSRYYTFEYVIQPDGQSFE